VEQNGAPMWAKWPCARQAASTSRRRTGSCKGSPIVSVSSSRGAMAIATVRGRSGRFLPPRERRRVSTPDFLMTKMLQLVKLRHRMQNVKTPLPMGTIIQRRYFIQGLLGSGCFGSVYLVRDQRVTHNVFNRFVLKEVINPNKHERYQITFEGMLLKLLHHRALPSVFRVISDDKHHRVYILMDYIEGPNLEMLWLQQPEKRFSLPEVVSTMAPIIDAV